MYVSSTLQETISHGDLMFKLKVYDDKKINPLMDLYAHWHEEIEIIHVLKGPFTLLINGKEYIAKTGDTFIINSHDLHQAYHYQQANSLHYAIVFNLELLNSFQFDSCQHKYLDPITKGKMLFPTVIDANSSSKVKELLENICQFYQQHPNGWELGIKANLLHLLVTLIVSNEMIITEEEMRAVQLNKLSLVKRSLEYMHGHYQEKIVISEMASSIHISTEYYNRIFKLYTGKTPVEYLNDYRIEQASKLLISSDRSILDIALECGFENTSYFIRKFKEKKEMTPKKFRTYYMET